MSALAIIYIQNKIQTCESMMEKDPDAVPESATVVSIYQQISFRGKTFIRI
jgi:hypothetical protein